jgi:uncharacterized protein
MKVIQETIKFVKEKLKDDSSGHDWWHIYRVWKTSKNIASNYKNCDQNVIELSALLHDIADWKDNDGDFSLGAKVSREWLANFDSLTKEQIDHICFIVENISFKGANADKPDLSLEGQIVQDADRLDAMGAMGVARTFAYGGHKGQLIYHPEIPPIDHINETSYVKNNKPSTSVNHFYEKLLLLKDRLNTEFGKKLAHDRHIFMQNFLNQFYKEWEGEK